MRTFTGSMYTRQVDRRAIKAYLDAGAPESPITLSDKLSDLIKDVHDGKITFGAVHLGMYRATAQNVQGYIWDQLYHAKDSDWSL